MENLNGKDEEILNLIVLGPPSKPKGPLITSEITAKSCKLNWKTPEDDGGTPIAEYVIEKLCPKTQKWIQVGKTNPETLTFDVKGLQDGFEYEFRVSAVSDEGESEALVTNEAILAKNPFDKPDEPGRPEITDYDNQSVELTWTKPGFDGGSPITSYILQKRLKGNRGDLWENCGLHADVDNLVAKVGDLVEKQEVQFRVIAVNEGGESKPSKATNWHLVKHRKCKF